MIHFYVKQFFLTEKKMFEMILNTTYGVLFSLEEKNRNHDETAVELVKSS